MKKILLGFSILLLAAGCNANQQAQNNQDQNQNNTANQTAQVQSCTPADLNATASAQGATGALAGWVQLTNTSNNPCTISNANNPNVVLQNGTSNISVKQNGDDTSKNNQDVTLQPGQSVKVHFVWQNFCGTKLTQPVSVVLTLPGTTQTVTATLSGTTSTNTPAVITPRCDNRKTESELKVGNFIEASDNNQSTVNQNSNSSNPLNY